MKVGAMPWPGLVSAIVCVLLVLSAAAAFADHVDEALRSGTRAYIDSQAQGNGEGWVKHLLADLERDHVTGEYTPLTIKQFMIASACEDQNPHCAERIGTWANAIHAYASPIEPVTVSGDYIVLRLRAIVDEMYPAPPPPPIVPPSPRSIEAYERSQR